MTIEYKSFYNYLMLNENMDTDIFKKTFKERLSQLPDRVASSKYILRNLQINNEREFKIFQNAFLEYFKCKLKE